MARAEKRRRRSTAAVVPDDLLFSEVLVRLPVKSLARFKSVCRAWHAGIADPAFVRRHRELSRARPPSVLAIPREVDLEDDHATAGEISFHRLLPGYLAPGTEAELVFEKAWPEGITCLILPAHCDGLVAVATTTDRVFVCNPATREFVALPPGSHNAELDHCELLVPPVALGFDPWRNSYVVARYFYRMYGELSFDEVTGEYSQDYDIGHEVFTLEGGDSWELTQDPPHAVGIQRPICTRLAFYWHADVPQPRLVRFGLQDRTFDVVSRPPAGWNAIDDMTELEGKLCYVHATAEASFQVWVADDGPKLEWSLRCRVDLPNPEPSLNYTFKPVSAGGDEMLVMIGSKLCRYDIPSKAMEEVADMRYELRYERPDGGMCICEPVHALQYYVVPYLESLVSLNACNY